MKVVLVLVLQKLKEPIKRFLSNTKHNNGYIICLPSMYKERNYKLKSDYTKNSILFINAIFELMKELNYSEGDYSLPDWAIGYILPSEKEIREKIEKGQIKLDLLLSKQSKLKRQKEEIELRKNLICGSGKALENQCVKILEKIGFEICESENVNREDLIIKWKQIVYIIEIKGLTSSAAEKNAAQLEKWVSEYQIKHDIKTKANFVSKCF